MAVPAIIRIMTLCPQLATGGAETQLLMFCRHVDRSRFSIHVVYYQQAGSIADRLREVGVALTYLDRSRLGPLGLLWALRRTIREARPDILDCRLPSAYRFGRLAALGCCLPVIVAQERTVGKAQRVRTLFDRLLNPFTDAWIGNSQAVADHVARDLHVRKDKIHVIPNGIETQAFVDSSPHPVLVELKAGNKRIVLNLGRLHEAKNQRLFLRVCQQLKEVFDDLAFVICGGGALMDSLVREARRLKLEEDCLFMGHQSDVPAILAGADLLIQTSDYEGMPNVVAEAMCAGVPVVATDVGGTAEVITNGQDGFLVPPGDVKAISARAMQVLESKDLAARLSSAGRNTILIRFSAEAMADRYQQLFTNLLQSRHNSNDR